MSARNASDEKSVRTPFQKFHGPSYSTLARESAAGAASPTRASSSFAFCFADCMVLGKVQAFRELP